MKIIVDNNCVVCHNSRPNAIGPFPLKSYEQVKDNAENGAILYCIKLPDGDPNIMPKNGKLPQNLIDVILVWVDQGYLLE